MRFLFFLIHQLYRIFFISNKTEATTKYEHQSNNLKSLRFLFQLQRKILESCTFELTNMHVVYKIYLIQLEKFRSNCSTLLNSFPTLAPPPHPNDSSSKGG